MGALLFIAIFSISISFLCSILEAVLLSISPTFINLKKKEGKTFAETLEKLKKDVDKPLIAILTWNTIAHTVGAILVGVQAKVAYVETFGSTERNFWGIPFTEELMVGIVSSVMTILILVLSEIIPKTIGATYWKSLSNFTAKALIIMIWPLKITGILWLLQLTTKLIGKSAHGSVLSREDFSVMADMAHQEGVFEASESTLIKNLVTFKEVQTKSIMTPRTVMIHASETMTVSSFVQSLSDAPFSRIPVYKDTMDTITGFVIKTDVYRAMIQGDTDIPLSTIKREVAFVNRDISIADLFELLIQGKHHMAIVVDEYGTVSGLVTMEDVIETLLGMEIMDESDNVADLQEFARKIWKSRAGKLGIIEDEDTN